jgi:acyl carrier protein
VTTLETVKTAMADMVKGQIPDDASWTMDLGLDSIDWAELMMALGDKCKREPDELSDLILERAQITKALTPRTIAEAIDGL